MPGSVVSLLEELIEIRSVSGPEQGLRVGVEEARRVLGVLRSYSDLPLRLTDAPGQVLLAVLGSGRPVTLFMAHFDVVPPGPGWTRDPFTPVVEGGRLYGRGAADDKGNVAAMAAALDGFEPGRGTVVVAFTGDEEVGGAHGAGWLVGHLRGKGLWPDYLVNGDGAFSRVIVRRRSVFRLALRVERVLVEGEGSTSVKSYRLGVKGRDTRHAAYFIPGVDSHPVLEAAVELSVRGLKARRLSGEWVKSNVLPASVEVEYVEPCGGCGRALWDEGLTWGLLALIPLTRLQMGLELFSEYGVTATPNVYRLEGGWHVFDIDVRAMTASRDLVEEAAYRALREFMPKSLEWSIEVTGGGGYLYTPRGSRLVELALRINSSLGLSGEPMEAAGASDSRYFSPKGVEAIDYGPKGGGVHGPDEYVEISSLEKTVQFYKRLAQELNG